MAKCIRIIFQLYSPDVFQGRKPRLQQELLAGITLLSPEYLLSIKRRPFHEETPDHYKPGINYRHKVDLITCLLELSLLQSICLYCYYTLSGASVPTETNYIPPLLFRRFPPQANYQAQTFLYSYMNNFVTLKGIVCQKHTFHYYILTSINKRRALHAPLDIKTQNTSLCF